MDPVFYEKLTNACHRLLLDNKKIYKYLKKRKILENTIKEYKLGAFPDDLRDLFRYISPVELKKNGIIYCADKSPFSLYPLVIPIRNSRGIPVAIGCRTLLDEVSRKELGIPKYKNSVYSKSSHLFGLDKAKSEIKKKNRVFVVEGYFDAISAHQYGMRNVVATCGTLFSQRQLIILSRYTNNISILFDNDDPGRNNAKTILDKFSNNEHINISCIFTPSGFKDLDEYLSSCGDSKYFDAPEN